MLAVAAAVVGAGATVSGRLPKNSAILNSVFPFHIARIFRKNEAASINSLGETERAQGARHQLERVAIYCSTARR